METHLPTPMTTRVYVNLLEGKSYGKFQKHLEVSRNGLWEIFRESRKDGSRTESHSCSSLQPSSASFLNIPELCAGFKPRDSRP